MFTGFRWLVLGGVACFVGSSFCRAGNDLTLEANQGSCCLRAGDSVTVRLVLRCLLRSINGVQVLIEFDDELLSLEDVIPGDGAGSPWDMGMGLPQVSDGQITYMIVLLGTSTDQDAVVARFVFSALSDGLARVGFRLDEPPLVSKLTAYPNGETVVPQLHDPAEIVLAALGDSNADGQVDLTDFVGLAACLTGPVQAEQSPTYPLGAPNHCGCFDFDADGDVDLVDFAKFANCIAEARGKKARGKRQ